MTNQQEIFWSGKFGDKYTDRNVNVNDSTLEKFGVSRIQMNMDFLDGLKLNNILEVGCNRAEQLSLLKHKVKVDLYGIDINDYALCEAREYNPELNLIKGSALDIPFKDNYFDLVFTSGVLIHIHPDNLKQVMSEIYRCSKEYILGFEYHSFWCQEITYRGNKGFLWKNDFKQLYLDTFPDLELVKETFYRYKDNSGCVDNMFLLKKKS